MSIPKCWLVISLQSSSSILLFLNVTKLFAYDTNSNVSFNTFIGVLLLQCTGLILYKLVLVAKRNKRLIACFIAMCPREVAEDDLELFEMATADRGDESESEDDGSEGDNMIDSLPSY